MGKATIVKEIIKNVQRPSKNLKEGARGIDVVSPEALRFSEEK